MGDIEKKAEYLVIPETGIGDVSDGYHTFNQLYYQRAVLFATIVNLCSYIAWKSWKHSDGKYCFDSNGEWFIVGIDTPEGLYTYHFKKEYWDLFKCKELECGKKWDGHTEKDVIRLLSIGSSLASCMREYSRGLQTAWEYAREYDNLTRKEADEVFNEYSVDVPWSLPVTEAIGLLEMWKLSKEKNKSCDGCTYNSGLDCSNPAICQDYELYEEENLGMREPTRKERESVDRYIKSICKSTGVKFDDSLNDKDDYNDATRDIEAYKKGIYDAWECARKISDMSRSNSWVRNSLIALFKTDYLDYIVKNFDGLEAIGKLKKYENDKDINVRDNCLGCKFRYRKHIEYPCSVCSRILSDMWRKESNE